MPYPDYMPEHERRIADALLDAILARGWSVTVSWPDEGALSGARRTRDAALIRRETAATDMTRWRVYAAPDSAAVIGSALLVHGNEPGVLVADLSAPTDEALAEFEAFVDGATAAAVAAVEVA